MKDTGFWVPQENADRLVTMNEDKPSDEKSKKGATAATYLQPPVILMGGTGLVSTTMDYLRFCQMLLNNGELDGVFMVNGLDDDKDWGHMPYSMMLEHYTYQAIVD